MSENKSPDIIEIHEVSSTADLESNATDVNKLEAKVADVGYKRQITGRQILMITFGAGIGTGFYVGMGTALRQGGPFGIVFAYIIEALIVYIMFIQVGEMTNYQPIHGGFINQIRLYMDDATAFAMGINFAFSWMVCLAAELTAGISVLEMWDSKGKVSTAEYIVIFATVYFLLNIWPVKVYGYIEYAQSIFKIISMSGITLFMFIVTCGGLPNQGPIGYKFWKNPGWLRNGIKGIIYALAQAGFAFGGGEHIAVVAGEVKHPRRYIPKAVNPIFWRFCIFFVGNAWLITMCVPYDDEILNNSSGSLASPYIVAMKRGGVKFLPNLFNAMILLAVISCGTSSVYIGSRSLVACSDLNLIHPIFGWKDRAGRPVVSLAVTFVVGVGLAFLNCSKTGVQVYNWFNSLVALDGYFNWLTIYMSHYRFRKGLKVQGIDYKSFKLYDHLFPWTTYIGIIIIFALFIAQFYIGLYPLDDENMSAGDRAENFFMTYLCVIIFACCYFYYKLRWKSKVVKPEDMDFSYGKEWDKIEKMEEIEYGHKWGSKKGKLYSFLEKYFA